MTVAAHAQTLAELLLRAAEQSPDRDVLVFPDQRMTYGELLASARKVAKCLMAVGVQPGDHVGIYLPNSFDFVEVMFGVALAGGVTVPVNGRYVSKELAYLTENADLVTIVTFGHVADSVSYIERLKRALPNLAGAADCENLSLPEAPKLRNVIAMGQREHAGCVGRRAFLACEDRVSDAELDARIAGITPEDMALILYTSGTTSNPKGCLIPHGAICSNSQALGVDRYKLTASDNFWSPLPIFHIAGILPLCAVMHAVGGYIMMPYFDAGQALDLLENEGATAAYPCFVTIMQDLINHPSFYDRDLSKVRLMNSNFAVQPPEIKEAMAKAMPNTIQVGTYGLSEASGTISTSYLDDSYAARTEKLGSPLRGWEIRVIDPETGADRPTGARGEIIAKGPGMLTGYYKDPEKTAETIDEGGWLHTGDVGSLDADGRIMFHGRLKDMLKIGGENVAASEIESHLESHPAVKLAQVVSVPHQRLQEVAAAFIEFKPGQSVSDEELISHCKGEIASFKVPRYVRAVDEWPMSTSKIQKFKLRDGLVAELGL